MFHVCSSNPFREKGFWFKGNLHTHTTNSDGALSPEQTIRLYKKNGYDFLSITDHEVVTGIKQLSEVFKDGFLLIPGAELAVGRSETQTRYHIVALNLEHMIETGDDPQTAIDNVKNEGGEALVAHPSWSALTTHDILKLKGYLGIEIFNSTCHFAVSKGYSTIHWDGLLNRNIAAYGFAVDDAHYHFNEHRPVDACYAWIHLKAPKLTLESVMESIRKGLFYSSNGPEIFDVNVTEESVTVKSSPAKAISFITKNGLGQRFTAMNKPMTEAKYLLRGNERYLRIEVEDGNGGTAWTNAIVFNRE